VLVFVGDGSSGKTAAMLKMVQYPLTVKSMGLRSEYVIDGRNDMYDLPNSESACICVVSDKIKAVCNRDFEETLKSSTDKKRVVNIKSGEQIEAGAIGYLLITNFPFFISQENVKPLLQDRFIFVQFEPKNYTDNRDFLNKELDRNTYFSILERCTATPEESESSKALKAD
jgi:GTPase SAR1 family protein